ncbi:unnamed protein product [Sphacelaria rigidula]
MITFVPTTLPHSPLCSGWAAISPIVACGTFSSKGTSVAARIHTAVYNSTEQCSPPLRLKQQLPLHTPSHVLGNCQLPKSATYIQLCHPRPLHTCGLHTASHRQRDKQNS